MKLTNRQLSIVVNKIYGTVSKPLKEANDKLLASVKVPNHQYFKDRKIWLKLEAEVEELRKKKEKLERKYIKQCINEYHFNRWSNDVFSDATKTNYTKKVTENQVSLKSIPTKDQIEEEIILSSNSDIPELIEKLTNTYLKQ